MEHDNNRRPPERGKPAVSRERPKAQAVRPKDARPRTGTASEREARRRARTEDEQWKALLSDAVRQSQAGGQRRTDPADARSRSREAAAQSQSRQAEAAVWARERQERMNRTRRQSREPVPEPTPAPAVQPEPRSQPPRQREEAPKPREEAPRPRTEAPRPQVDASLRDAVPHKRAAARERDRSAPKDKPRKPAPAKAARAEEAPPRPPRKKRAKPHRVYDTNFGFKFAILLAVVAVIVLSMVIFFKIKHIEVVLPTPGEGRTPYYTAQEIIDASGVNLDDNLLSLSKATVASRIHTALPYVNELQIKKQFPGTVVITFTEFEVTYGVQDETGAWWLMSREGRILEPVEEQEARTHLRVTGMPIKVPKVGESFTPAATEGADMSEIAAKQKVVLEVIPALEQTAFVKSIDRVDVSTSYDLTLWWEGERYKVRLGTVENLTYKLQFLAATLENSEIQARSGVIDLTFNEDDKVHFLEFR